MHDGEVHYISSAMCCVADHLVHVGRKVLEHLRIRLDLYGVGFYRSMSVFSGVSVDTTTVVASGYSPV